MQPWAAVQARDWGLHTAQVLKQDIFLSPQLSSPTGREWRGVTMASTVRYLLPPTPMKRRLWLWLCWTLWRCTQGSRDLHPTSSPSWAKQALSQVLSPKQPPAGMSPAYGRGATGAASFSCPVSTPTCCVSHLLNARLKTSMPWPATGLGCPNAIQLPGECTTWMPVPRQVSPCRRDPNCPVCSVTEEPGALYNTLLCTARFCLPFRLWIRLGFGIFPFFGLLFGILFCFRFSGRGMRHFAPLAVCTWLWPTK